MMQKGVAMLMAIIAALTVSSAVAVDTYVPLVLWTNYNKIFDHPVNDFSVLKADKQFSVDQVVSTLKAVQNNVRGETVDLMSAQTPIEVAYFPPKAFVLFARESLRLDELSSLETSKTEKLISSATSTVSFAHTTRSEAESLVSKISNAKTTSIEHVKDFLANNVNTLGTDGSDLVIVTIPNSLSWPKFDALLSNAASMFEQSLDNKVYFGLTGDKSAIDMAKRQLIEMAVKTPLLCEPGYILSSNGEFCFSHYVNMTPEIMSGIFVGLFLIFGVYVGLYYLDGIQTPTKYPSVAPPKGKEY